MSGSNECRHRAPPVPTIHRILPILALTSAAPLAVSAQDVPLPAQTQWAQLTIRERLIVRIPRLAPPRTPPAAPPVVWSERKAPKCLPVSILSGASFTGGGDVDLIVRGGQRMRAKLDDDCPTLSFYSGFYVKPAPDGMICQKRDAIRSRSGARCEIRRFRALVPRR